MTNLLIQWVWSHDLPAPQKFVLLMLGKCISDDEPTIENMANLLGLDRKTIMKALRGLADKHLIIVERETGRKNQYVINYRDGQ